MRTKSCPVCGKVFSERPNEGPMRFTRRRTCSPSCGQFKTGQSRSAEYGVWHAMRERCERETSKAYDHYGGRGIYVCDRWKEFANFLADMGHRPSPKHTIERRNNDGNYEPSNCCWATRTEQQNNRRANIRITLDGTSMTATQWDRAKGFKPGTISSRLQRGWTEEEAINTQPRYGNKPKDRKSSNV